MKTIVLYSGGLDSLLLWLLHPSAQPVRVSYGQAYEQAERRAIERQQQAVGLPAPLEVHVQLAEALPDGHVLHRNLALITIAAARTGATRILLGGVRGETSPDKSARFLRAAGRALTASEGVPVHVEAPLRYATKARHLRTLVAAAGAQRAQELLDTTASCYQPAGTRRGREVGCGECLACYRRWVAVRRAGLRADFLADPADRDNDRRQALRYLLATPVGEWPGVVANQLEALRAHAA